jgi:putative mRNA 3-end processing factor
MEFRLFEYFKNGIRITDSPLWLDPSKKMPFAYVSHAHADHIRKHQKIIATPATVSFFEKRCGRTESIPLDYHTPYRLNHLEIELFPSGHMLGSSQIQIVRDGVRFVYTGDFNTAKSETMKRIEIRPADILIMECTFGLPRYQFPPRWEIIEMLITFIEDSFDRGLVPVIFCYTLGKGQEVLKILGDRGYQLSVYTTIYDMAKIYEHHGISFNNMKKFEDEDLKNRVMLLPAHMKNWIEKRYAGAINKAVVTGWAVDSGARYRYGADVAIPLSDHADFNGLIDYVKRASPKVVYLTHGFTQFAQYLQKEGFDARPLVYSSQISLF